ncbi:hypothetical protein EDB89DRAFT_1314553 [Lactarius sanguifluus]|nr:hypothetical protein EDB89DRAFT_1314553 [Lactarius sanguifluus]
MDGGQDELHPSKTITLRPSTALDGLDGHLNGQTNLLQLECHRRSPSLTQSPSESSQNIISPSLTSRLAYLSRNDWVLPVERIAQASGAGPETARFCLSVSDQLGQPIGYHHTSQHVGSPSTTDFQRQPSESLFGATATNAAATATTTATTRRSRRRQPLQQKQKSTLHPPSRARAHRCRQCSARHVQCTASFALRCSGLA